MRARLLNALLWPCVWACSVGSSDEPIASRAQPILDGIESGPEQNAVVALSARNAGLGTIAVGCTGTLVAPNLVLTSRRCLSSFDFGPPLHFSCTPEGYIDLEFAREPFNAGELGAISKPEDVWVFVGQDPDREEPDAQGVEIFSYATESVCRNDIAYVLLDTPLDPEPKPLRLNAGVSLGELTRVLGYAGTYAGERRRQERGDLAVLATGEGPYTERSGATPVRTFMLGESACGQRDAGGPALSEETGAILGVFSHTAGDACSGAEVRNVFTQVAAYSELTAEAFAAAGHEPRRELGAAGAGGRAGEIDEPDAATARGSGGAGGAGDRGASTNPPGRSNRGDGCACRLGRRESTPSGQFMVAMLALAAAGWGRRKRHTQG